MFGNQRIIPYICTYKRYIFNKLKDIKMKNKGLFKSVKNKNPFNMGFKFF